MDLYLVPFQAPKRFSEYGSFSQSSAMLETSCKELNSTLSRLKISKGREPSQNNIRSQNKTMFKSLSKDRCMKNVRQGG